MINLRKIMETLANEIKVTTGKPSLQVLDRKFLDNIPEKLLETPRVIVDLLDVNDSRFYYEIAEFENDSMEIGATRTSYVDISINFISDFSDSLADEMAEMVKDYYNNPFTEKLMPYNVVITDPIDIKDINQWGMKKDLNIIRLRMRFRLSNTSSFLSSEWAEHAQGKLYDGNGKDLTFKN